MGRGAQESEPAGHGGRENKVGEVGTIRSLQSSFLSLFLALETT